MAAESYYFVNRSGLRLHVLRWGRPDGLPVVLLHGLRAYAQTWAPLVAALGKGFCCHALDQRGRGLSDWAESESYRTETYVDDIEDLVRHARLDRFVLIGHSMGGANALEYARRHPDRLLGLVIEDIGPGASSAGAGAERIRREMRDTPLWFDSWNAARDFWRRSRTGLSEAGLASRLTHSMKATEQGVTWRHDQEGIARARLSIPPIDLWPAIRAVDCPALLIRGGRSDFLSPQTLAAVGAANPRIRTVEIPDAGHYVHDEQSECFNREVMRFLGELDGHRQLQTGERT